MANRTLTARTRTAGLRRTGRSLDWEAVRQAATPDSEPPLFVDYAFRRLEDHERRLGFRSGTSYRSIIRLYLAPAFAGFRIGEIQAHHARKLIEELIASRLAVQSVHNVYNVLRRVHTWAVSDSLIPSNPVRLPRGELPARRQVRIRRRMETSVVLSLISSPRIPTVWRTLYALLFFTGSRIGEVSALRWSAWERDVRPLSKLVIAEAYNTESGETSPPKTDAVREIPVVKPLAKMLEAWWASGWAGREGRDPTADDLVFPRLDGETGQLVPRASHGVLKRLKRDLHRLGFGEQRTHDARHTFVSLTVDAGIPKIVAKPWTHARPRTVYDGYADASWAVQCEEIAKVARILRKRGGK